MRIPASHLILVAWLGLLVSVRHAAGGIAFEAISVTPYDAQMSRVEEFIRLNASQPGDDVPPLSKVNEWMSQLHSIPYRYSSAWRTPDEMQQLRTGDCKSKAVCLYYLMRAYGARNVMLVVGRRSNSSKGTHAWLLWKSQGRVYLLDPSVSKTALEMTGQAFDQYIPHYAYSAGKKYRPVAG